MLLPLIALTVLGETSTAEMTAPVIIASIAGGIIVKVADAAFKFFKDTRSAKAKNREVERKYRKEDESEVLDQWKSMLERVERNLEESQQREQRAIERERRASLKAERAVTWIKHLESRLRENNIPFDPWVDDDPEEVVQNRGDAETDVGADGGY